ncbi:MAG: hypothetical protein FWG52_10345 [Proteobacteria bacterium]|nr:hypothetical protein [Pseudomonadota bacterium]
MQEAHPSRLARGCESLRGLLGYGRAVEESTAVRAIDAALTNWCIQRI